MRWVWLGGLLGCAGPGVEPAVEQAAQVAGTCDEVVDFMALSEADGQRRWLFAATADLDTTQGSCGGPGPEARVRFVAPRAATWRFLATPDPGHDPLLYARRTCDDPASELACHVDLPSDGRARLHLDLAAGEVVDLIVDSENLRGGFFTLEAEPVPRRALGEPCDLDGLQDACPAGASCSTLDGHCAEDGPPRITGAPTAVRLADGTLALTVPGADVGRDVVGALVQLYADGALLPLNAAGAGTWAAAPQVPVLGQAEFVLAVRAVPPGEGRRGEKLRVRLRDAQGQTTAPAWVVVAEGRRLTPGQACDPQDFFAGCPADAPCRPAGKGHRCTPRRAPQVVAARGTAGPEGLGLWLEVRDADGDAAEVAVALPDGPTFQAPLSRAVSWRAAAPVGPAEVVVIDRSGRRSAPVAVPLEPAPEVEAGQPCDPQRGFDTCAEGLTCVGTCVEPVATCPAEVEVRALAGGGPWFAFGDTSAAASFAPGSCGRGTAQDIYRFVPPTSGEYSLALWSGADGADPTLSVRTHCALPGTTHPEHELGCNDDSWGLEPRLRLELAAGEPVFVVVDGFGWQGPYVLQINAVQP